MNASDFETRLKQALAVATPQRSIVDDVMRQLPASPPQPAGRSRWRRPLLAVGLATPSVIAATLFFLFYFAGSAAQLTLADVKAAVERQAWMHVRYDVGPFKETWTNLLTGEGFTTRIEGSVVYVNPQTNTRLWYAKNAGVIQQDAPVKYPPGQAPRPWTPQTAWEQIVAPLEREVATTPRAGSSPPSVVSAHDSLNGKPVIRFDIHSFDSLGKRFLYAQLWADPRTHLPVRVKTRLQLAYREAAGKEWSVGEYDFPATGPADLYALGVPRGTPIEKEVTTAPQTVQPVLDSINRAHDTFLKKYRAVIWTVRDQSPGSIDQLDIIWRDGDRVRQDHHLPAFERQENRAPRLPALNSLLKRPPAGEGEAPAEPDFAAKTTKTAQQELRPPIPQQAAALLAWATQAEATEKQLMDSHREYTWRSAASARTARPQVQVIQHGPFPLLATNAWPEHIQWPTRYYSLNFQLLEANAETPAGCIGLRRGGGNFRSDYYVDPQHDYVCLKQIHWTKRGAAWAKEREYALSGLDRVAGHVVAHNQHFHGYGDPARRLSDNTETVTIDLVPLTAADFPPGIFDAAGLTTGAKVEGF